MKYEGVSRDRYVGAIIDTKRKPYMWNSTKPSALKRSDSRTFKF